VCKSSLYSHPSVQVTPALYEFHRRLPANEWPCAFACSLFVLEKAVACLDFGLCSHLIIPSALMRLIATFALYSDYYSPVNLFEAISQITAITFLGDFIVAITIQPKVNKVSPD
jgi:hypothetical protein